MTNRYLMVLRSVFVALTVVAIVCVPLTSAMAQRTLGEGHRTDGLAAKDGTEFLNTGDDGEFDRLRTYARANYIWPFATGPHYASANIFEPGVISTPAGTRNRSGCRARRARARSRANMICARRSNRSGPAPSRSSAARASSGRPECV